MAPVTPSASSLCNGTDIKQLIAITPGITGTARRMNIIPNIVTVC